MKKYVMRILAAVLALAMVFSLAACGNDDKGPGSSTDGPSSSETSSQESSETASTPNGMFATVKDFLDDPKTKAQLDESISQMVGDDNTISVNLEGTDDTLIYNFKFSDEAMATADEDSLKADLAEVLDESNFVSTFEGIAESLGPVVNVDTVKVKVVYAKADGTELASKVYSKK